MPLSVKNFNKNSTVSKNHKSNLSFTGLKTGNVAHLKAIQNITNCNLGGMFDNLKNKAGSDFLQGSTYKKANSLADTLKYPFTKMPLEILNFISEKFKIQSLYDSKLLVDFRKAGESEAYERAFRGLLQNGDAFLDGVAKDKGFKPSDIETFLCNGTGESRCGNFHEICSDVVDKYFKNFDENLTSGKAKYNTTHERTIARLVSGIIPAIVLGNDFYNKSIKNGKSEAEAEKEAAGKRKQEIIATAEEAASQYFMLGAFSSFVNNSTFGAPIINTLLGLGFHITSRLSTGRPLTRIKAPEAKTINILSMNSFMDSIKNKKPVEFEEVQPQIKKDDKKHLLSFKNIALACLASIGAGFALRNFKNTKTFENIKNSIMNFEPVKAATDKFKKATTGELLVDKKEFKNFANVLNDCKYKDMLQYYRGKIKDSYLLKEDGKYYIGQYEKFAKIPLLNIEISKKELYSLPLAPLKIVKEIVTYPYKLVSSALEGLKVIDKPVPNKLDNKANLVNTFLDFRKQAEKFDGNIESEEFLEHYAKHIEKNWLSSLNKETKSNVDNCNIGRLTALLGVFASIYFATTDDYNATLSQTGDVEKANKDARLRGVNKIIRTSVQNVVMCLNGLFKIPYGNSLIGAGAITAGVTLITDNISRVLSGMPSVKMNKEQLEQYNKNKKEGALKWYYNALDKLTD